MNKSLRERVNAIPYFTKEDLPLGALDFDQCMFLEDSSEYEDVLEYSVESGVVHAEWGGPGWYVSYYYNDYVTVDGADSGYYFIPLHMFIAKAQELKITATEMQTHF